MTIVRRTAAFTVALGILAYGALCAFLYLNQERMIFHPEVLPAAYNFRFAEPFDEDHIDVDGARLSVLRFRVPRPKGVVVYFHGNAESLRTWGEVGGMLAAEGYEVVMPDYRGYGKSTGRISSEQMLLEDALTVYDDVANRQGEDRIVVWGRSLGSAPATWIAARRSPRRLVLESAYYSFRELAKESYPFAPEVLLKYPLPTNEWIGSVKCPVVLIHGRADDVIPFESSVRLNGLVKAQQALFLLEGVGHNDLTTSQAYKAVLARVLQ